MLNTFIDLNFCLFKVFQTFFTLSIKNIENKKYKCVIIEALKIYLRLRQIFFYILS